MRALRYVRVYRVYVCVCVCVCKDVCNVTHTGCLSINVYIVWFCLLSLREPSPCDVQKRAMMLSVTE